MSNIKTSELVELEVISANDLFNVSEDLGGGSYISKKFKYSALVASTSSISTKTTTYLLTSSDNVILADTTTAAFTLTLPAASTVTGKTFTIKKINISGNAVTIDGNASETIDGSLTKEISDQYASMSIVSNGTNWFII